jgi:hypothetical protein
MHLVDEMQYLVFGSLLSVIGTILFGYIIFDLFTNKSSASNNP